MRYAKQFGIPLHGFYELRDRAPEAGYGGAIPLAGYTDIRGLTAKYDRKEETLYLAFTAERSNIALTASPVPADLADAEVVPVKPTRRGDIHTAYARTKAIGDRALIAVPDVTECVESGSAEEAPGALADKSESLLVVILPEESEIPGFVYKEPLLTFYRDGKSFYAYVEEQSNATLPAVIGTIDAALAPVTPPQFAPGSTAEPASPPEVEHLGATDNGTYAQRFRIGLQGYFDTIAHDIGYAVQGKPSVFSFMPVDEYDEMDDAEVEEWLERNYGDGVYVGSAGDYAVFAAYHED